MSRPDLRTPEWAAIRERVLGGHVLACRKRGCTGIGVHPVRCFYCHGWGADTVDHIVPVALGGDPLDPANTVPACRSCNSSKGARFEGTDRFANAQFAARTYWRRRGTA